MNKPYFIRMDETHLINICFVKLFSIINETDILIIYEDGNRYIFHYNSSEEAEKKFNSIYATIKSVLERGF